MLVFIAEYPAKALIKESLLICGEYVYAGLYMSIYIYIHQRYMYIYIYIYVCNYIETQTDKKYGVCPMVYTDVQH